MLVQGFNGNNEVDQGIRPMGRSKQLWPWFPFRKRKENGGNEVKASQVQQRRILSKYLKKKEKKTFLKQEQEQDG